MPEKNRRLAKLATLIPPEQIRGLSFEGYFVSEVKRVGPRGEYKRYIRLVPILEDPAIPPFVTHHGGGRTHGGGFSKEALRKAKRKEKATKNNRGD